MEEYKFKPTTHGRAALVACMALKQPPDICRVAFGSGRISGGKNLADQHELIEYVSDGTIGDFHHENDHFYFTIQYANSAHKEVGTFYLSEFIVYIKDPVTGEETDLLYGKLGDYRLPVPQYHDTIPPSVFDLPLVMVISDEVTVQISAPSGLVTYGDLHNAVDRAVEDGLSRSRRVIATRIRDPSKPTYGLGGGGDDGGERSVVLETGPYTGTTEAGVVVNGVLYDALNMSAHGDTAPDGTIIID